MSMYKVHESVIQDLLEMQFWRRNVAQKLKTRKDACPEAKGIDKDKNEAEFPVHQQKLMT
jgi:hypothetical protein